MCVEFEHPAERRHVAAAQKQKSCLGARKRTSGGGGKGGAAARGRIEKASGTSSGGEEERVEAGSWTGRPTRRMSLWGSMKQGCGQWPSEDAR
eukprot:ctg_1891.g635